MGPDLLVTRLIAIRDARMRVLALVDALGAGEPGEWVEVFAAIVARAHTVDDADATETLECITHAAAEPGLHYSTRQALYEAAVARNLPAIARLFLAASPPADVPRQLAKQLGPERPLRPTDRPLTLGERKALARTHDREQLLLLARDPHPAVVSILLDNPHVTETEIVKMAALRPAASESLAKIAAHPRWSVRHAVKRALVFNPSTPLADAIRIATTLRRAELAEIAGEHSLPELLRTHAADVLANLSSRPRA
ncbi:MAG TPA: hypothetical protein VMJ10_31145 [Kofleriaceae bacterium]|nr:hypothetical protein [Kofleriaceae bacterium]